MRIFHEIFLEKCKRDIKKNYTNDNCVFCKLCEKLCPNGNIKMGNERPSWGDNCEQCMACLQWCPSVAINRIGVPENRHRYQNPGIEAEDLINDMQR